MKTTDPDGDDPTKGSQALPSRRKNPNMRFARDDGKIDLLARMLRQGDPLADAVDEELQTHGVEARQALEAGSAMGWRLSATFQRPSRHCCGRPKRCPHGLRPKSYSAAPPLT